MSGGDNENGGSGSFSGNVRKFTQAPTPTKYKSQGGGTGDWRPAPHLADWDHWGQMPSAPLWEAVALSLNWEPHSMIGPTYQVSFDFSRQRAPKEFQSHLAVAEKCMTRGEIPSAQRVENAPYSEVDLKPFAAWAISKGWEIPDEFPRDLGTTAAPKARGRPPGSPYEATDALLVEKMRAIQSVNPDKSAAKIAREISAEIEGDGSPPNKERRLCRKYTLKYPS